MWMDIVTRQQRYRELGHLKPSRTKARGGHWSPQGRPCADPGGAETAEPSGFCPWPWPRLGGQVGWNNTQRAGPATRAHPGPGQAQPLSRDPGVRLVLGRQGSHCDTQQQ